MQLRALILHNCSNVLGLIKLTPTPQAPLASSEPSAPFTDGQVPPPPPLLHALAVTCWVSSSYHPRCSPCFVCQVTRLLMDRCSARVPTP
eukprot:scaffold269841_cov22-Tisochrysis_lutea.AAC.1